MDDEEEDYVLFGTPLPEIEDEATLKKKSAKELQVRDEKGRQRFHGAFTGGFSAGYFNTVGTKDGWAPSTFISSRKKTADRIQQNPEDFMDDEDFGEFGIATRKIQTTSNFQDTHVTNTQKRKYVDVDSVIPGEAPLKDIIQPVRESIGILILKKMGWRQGQGIGPRVKKYSGDTKVYGCSSFPDAVNSEENDPIAIAFTFAPEDVEGMSYKSKDNYFGLGYTGLSKQSILNVKIDPFTPTSTKSWLSKEKKKLKISGQAFGVGALEDEDEDIYGKDDMSQYDFSDLALKVSEDSHKDKESLKYGNSPGILDGFRLASEPPLIKKHYPPPTLPSNFKPVHLKSVSSILQNVNLGKSRHTLSASDRSLILGERKFHKVSLNVADGTEEKQKSNFDLVHSLQASSATSNFQPFPNDLSKQQRYEEYLKLKETRDVGKLAQPSSMTEWERQQELEEFAKASILFKPLSNSLSLRFESRSHLSVEHEVMAALERIKKEKEEKQVLTKKILVGTCNRKAFEWHPVPLLCKRMNVPNPYPNSNSSGTESIFKTKSVFDHFNFSCKKSESTEKNEQPVLLANSSLGSEMEESSKNVPGEVQMQVAGVLLKNNENLTSEDKRPPMDFFKDIFESTSSEDEDNTKNEISEEKINFEKEKSELMKDEDCTVNDINSQNLFDREAEGELSQKKLNSCIQNSSISSGKVGFGVFANLDLDALNQRKPSEKSLLSDISNSNNDTTEVSSTSNLKDSDHIEKQSVTDDMYGPELPPDYSMVHTPVATPSPYKVSSSRHVKSKSRHKSKHHKHKHKHKKKKKKSSKKDSTSSDSSEYELDDIPPSLIIEKLKKLQKGKS